MKRRWGIVVVFLLVAGVASLLIWRFSSHAEPVYEGRKLTSWLDHHVASSAAEPPYGSPGWHKANEALRRIGTNAVPTLLKMVRAKDPPRWGLKVMEVVRRNGWMRINYRYATRQHDEAEHAFRVLGTNAASAVPGLINIYEQNISDSSQRCAALALGSIGPPAQAAVPVLLRRFHDPDSYVRFYAVSAVMRIGGDPAVIVPAFVSVLRDTNVNVRWNALVGLNMLGGRARAAVPEIMKMLDDPGMVGTSPIKEQVETALWRIAPEKVGKPLVIEAATPIIENRKTTEDLKMVLHRDRKTLISAGTSVPVVRQYWNSDPRPHLTIYRGEHLLGHFEVMDLPDSKSLNISTLCVIAEGQILLCARDNQGERFLEIRRVEP